MDEPDALRSSLSSSESYETALCILPPQDSWPPIDRFRAINDKGYGRWPPHISLIYPFVPPNELDKAVKILAEVEHPAVLPQRVTLTDVDTFAHRHDSIIFLRPNAEDTNHALEALATRLNEALDSVGRKPYQPHMTVAQSPDSRSDRHQFLLDKARLLSPISWELSEIAVLVREKQESSGEGISSRAMRLWGTIDLMTGNINRESIHPGFYQRGLDVRDVRGPLLRSQASFGFCKSTKSWKPLPPASPAANPGQLSQPVERLIVASYNVLADFEWPPSSSRHPHLVRNICSARARADVIVLQEVTDAFLEHLLSNSAVCDQYPFVTHGKPSNAEIGPLPNLLNIVVLSRYPMQWEYLKHSRKHKGSAIVVFPTLRVRQAEGEVSPPVVVAACHLSHGLTDAAVVAKKQEVHDLMNHLQSAFAGNPCIMAGDFNLTSSLYTIDMARKKGALTNHTLKHLRDFDSCFLENGFRDVWLETRLRTGESSGIQAVQQNLDQLHEGEQGATFDPLINTLAAKQVGFGLGTRPQRYDRIFVNDKLGLHPIGFNMFGQETEEGAAQYASDHWGVRCLLQAMESNSAAVPGLALTRPVTLRRAAESLGGLEDLTACLTTRGMLPTKEDEASRVEALELLRRVLVDEMTSQGHGDRHFKPVLVLIPVGSTALGVWTPKSDIDCLCVGGISSKTFFALAAKRLKKAYPEGIAILRKVRANSGTMLELLVQGIRFDLQYCPSIMIAEQYPDVLNRPSTDGVFSLPMQTLLKLKPARDLSYLRRSIPDTAQYRAAHLLIKAWAMSRGLYAAKFGFLGGIHLSILLVPICKSLVHAGHSPTVADVVATFFSHYAGFDWEKHMVFDPFFHKKLKYHRSFREPLCLLGWHAPSLNTAATASVPTVRTLVAEFERGDQLLSRSGQSWEDFLGYTVGEADFLSKFKQYVRINVHYWGSSPSKGNRLVGWIESRCAMLLVDLDRRVASLLPRMWPARFVPRRVDPVESTAAECQACYLIGLDRKPASTEHGSTSDVDAVEAALIAVLQDFEVKLKGAETYYDPQTCWLNVTIQRGSELGPLEADTASWGGHSSDQEQWEDTSDSEEEEDELGGEEEHAIDNEGAAAPPTLQPRSETSTTIGSNASKATKPSFAGLGKFRTATDVLNRLKWDPAMDSSDFIVGYEDRFAGAQEKALDKWKGDLTHEEFIPQHRILYFKRRSDGSKVWERSTRTDSIFGSGVRS